jgi:hypothetical protein
MLIVLASLESAIMFEGAPMLVEGDVVEVQLAKKRPATAAIVRLERIILSFFMSSFGYFVIKLGGFVSQKNC